MLGPLHQGWSRCFARAHLDTAPAWNGVATSSSPFQSHSQGDEDIAAPKPAAKKAPARVRAAQPAPTAAPRANLAQPLSTGNWPMPTAFFPLTGLQQPAAVPRAAAAPKAAATPKAKAKAPARKAGTRKPAAGKSARSTGRR